MTFKLSNKCIDFVYINCDFSVILQAQRSRIFDFLARKYTARRVCINLSWLFFDFPKDVVCDWNLILKDRSHPWIAMRFLFLCASVSVCSWKNQNVTLFKWEFRLCKLNCWIQVFERCSSFASLALFFTLSLSFITLYVLYDRIRSDRFMGASDFLA